MGPWLASHLFALVCGIASGVASVTFWFRLALRRPEVAELILESAAAIVRLAALRVGERRWVCPGCGRTVDGRPTLPDAEHVDKK